MAYVTTSYGRPIQGVSQQPDRIRLEGQCTLQENFLPDVVRGLTRRPSTYFVNKVADSAFSPLAKYHSYDRGDEAYLIIVEPNATTVRVFNMAGEEQLVEGTTSYVNSNNPWSNYDMRTIGDFTFITNKTQQVKMATDKSPLQDNTGIIYCQYATYGKTYKVIANGDTLASYQTPDGSDPSHINDVATDRVIARLSEQIAGKSDEAVSDTLTAFIEDSKVVVRLTRQAVSIISVRKGLVDTAYNIINSNTIGVPLASSGDTIYVEYRVSIPNSSRYTAEVHSNVMYIRKKDGSDFKLTTSDSQKGEDLIAIKGSIKSVNQLPPQAPDGFVVRITGEGKSTKDDYWLKATSNNDSKIRWVETVEPNVLIKFDATTMPHVLIRDSITSGVAKFKLQPADWPERKVGGDDSNPIPSFIDADNPQVIKATGVFQNRLFFLSGESWIASRSTDFFNFWKESSQAEADTDPLDGYADTEMVNNLYQYQVLNGSLVLFGDEAQFMIDGSKPVTKSNLTLQQITAYPANINVQPQAGGENIFFAYNASGYTGIRELFTDNLTDNKRALPITDYVSKYLVGKCNQLLASANFNTMMIRTDDNLSRIFVYDWLWQAEQKVQSAWHTWLFDGEVMHVWYIEEKMYLIYTKGGKTYMDYLHMVNDPADDLLVYSTKLDHKTKVTATYNNANGLYEFTLPYLRDDVVATVNSGGDQHLLGSAITAVYVGDGKWTTADAISDNKLPVVLLCGVKYKSRYIPTQPVVKDYRERVIGLDSIIMSNMYVHYEVTGHLRMKVIPKAGKVHDYRFDGRWMGSLNNLVGSPVLENGTYRAPIRQRAEELQIEIYSDSHYPLTIRDLEIDGTFHQRGQRI